MAAENRVGMVTAVEWQKHQTLELCAGTVCTSRIT